MSNNGPGSYSPPPAPRRGLSPWAWVGIGCAGLTVLGFGGCITAGVVFTNKIKSEMNKPFNAQEAVQAMADIPLYPGGQVDEMGSKAARAGLQAMSFAIPAQRSSVLALRSDDPNEKIFKWYDGKMGELGYKQQTVREETGNNMQHQYLKDKNMAIVQVQRSKGNDSPKLIVLMRFDGIKK